MAGCFQEKSNWNVMKNLIAFNGPKNDEEDEDLFYDDDPELNHDEDDDLSLNIEDDYEE